MPDLEEGEREVTGGKAVNPLEKIGKETVRIGEYDIKVTDKDPSKIEIPVVYMNITIPFDGLIGHMGEEGKVIITTVAVNAIWSQKREMGVRSVLEKYPGIEILELVNAPGDEQTAYAALENALLANPDLDGMISCGGTQYLWARLLENKGMGGIGSDHPIYNTGHDLYEEKLIQIKDGWATVAYGQNPYEQGYQAVKQIYEFLTTGDASKFKDIDTGVFRVDKSNVEKVLEMLYDGEPIG